MKVSREEAAANRERIVEAASRLFREHGFDGVGVADIMKDAGLTHGGFYGHFDSKEKLAAEACCRAGTRAAENWARIGDEAGDNGFEALLKYYLSDSRLDAAGTGCMFVSLASDASRHGRPMREAFEKGFNALIGALARLLSGRSKADVRKKAIAAFSEMVGAVVLARSVSDHALAREILATTKADLLARYRE